MNKICEIQDKKENIELLAAQRKLYSSSKRVFNIRACIVLVLVTVSFIPIDARIKPFIGLASIVFLFLDMFLLEKIEDKRRNLAARIQELFDTRVLDLDWNILIIGSKPDYESICEFYEKYKKQKKRDLSELMRWYAVDVCSIEFSTARALCQRSNIIWDYKQRVKVLNWIIMYLVLQTIGAIFTSMALELSLNDFIVISFLPLLPSYRLYIKRIDLHMQAYKRLEALKSEADKLINESNSLSESDLKWRFRTLQDAIFNHRKSAPAVPDWTYFKFRNKYESEMYYNVSAKIAELKGKN
jgi:hypothetical protein